MGLPAARRADLVRAATAARATADWPWLPVARRPPPWRTSVARLVDADVDLKWPNDLLVDGRKVGGLLAEVAGDALVIGIGLNVSTTRDELPVEHATSLALETAEPVDRTPVLLTALRAIGPAYLAWDAGELDPREAYLSRCATVGRQVRVELPGGGTLEGEATRRRRERAARRAGCGRRGPGQRRGRRARTGAVATPSPWRRTTFVSGCCSLLSASEL